MNPGKLLILAGLILIVTGFFYLHGGKLPFIGRLPGDIRIEKEHFTFYFPFGTSLLLSALLSLLFWLFRR